MRTKTSTAAFTLIELLSVVAIIGVLSALSLVGLDRMRDTARAGTCTANLRQIGVGLLSYTADNRGALPPCANLPSGAGYTFRPGTFWFDALNPYMGHPEFAADRAEGFPSKTTIGSAFPLMWQHCPAKQVDNPQRQTVGYGWNLTSFGHSMARTDTNPGARLSQIPRPASTIIIGDSKDAEFEPNNQFQNIYIYDYDRESRYAYPKRHKGGGNYLFVDGHVETIAAVDMSSARVRQMFKRN